jgi:low affinity Fe/Cu permease
MRPIKQTRSFFTTCSRATARTAGRPQAFLTALGVVIFWAATGPIFHFSNTWQLVINTGTTIITFLMVFLIQATQNRESEAVQLKLDELIRAIHGAHNALLDLEELEQKDLDKIRENYLALAKSARDDVKAGRVQAGRTNQKG